MALSGDHTYQVFLDSTYRNRQNFPHPTEFETTVKPEQSSNANDPLAIGYALFKDTVLGYDSTATPDRVQLTVGIDALKQNSLLGKYIEITNSTYDHKGTSKVVGFSDNTSGPSMYVYLSPAINNVISGDLIFIRQIQQCPLIRFNPTTALAAGSTSFLFLGGNKKDNAYKGLFFKNISKPVSDDYRIVSSSYNSTTSLTTINFSPPLETGGFLVTDFVEIYNVSDNECGMNEIGSVFNRGSPVNHEIRLEWLRIPRHSLYVANDKDVPKSQTITVNNFSYLLVEFRNKSFGSSRIVQSNNKHVKNCQFVVPIEDLSTTLGKFYTVRSSSSIITPYNPNDIIKFSVKLPNGQSIQFDPDDEKQDTLELPNPDMQVVAMFSIKRILT